MIHTVINESIISRSASRRLAFNNLSIVLITASITLLAIVGWLWTATSIVDLGIASNLSKSTLYAQWAKGDVVLMIRHAERCDRSSNPCLGSADGITVSGSHSAMAVSAGLRQLGLENARMITSPSTRTRQTADLILGRAVQVQGWLGDCDSGFKDAVLAHKKSTENLVLITHSGCIDQFERKMGVLAWERSSAYTEALFVKVDGTHAPRILGSMDATQWKNLNVEQLN
ncbi:histidine phosphatase family protein [Pseudomonas sp. CCM 7891]|uniref:Histidine phosphatase family protein n=1 Tax=Pseudomonas karstica TaxID=1055468 RepID=A0A7X2RX89_9PSED|nr:histidine phosphatase family protein [Pseudomonas karstica]